MCLTSVKTVYKKPLWKIGYKAFAVRKSPPFLLENTGENIYYKSIYFPGKHPAMYLGETYATTPVFNRKIKYRPGFHLFRNVGDAMEFGRNLIFYGHEAHILRVKAKVYLSGMQEVFLTSSTGF